MSRMGRYEQIKKAFQDIIALDTRIDGVDVRIEGLDHQLRTAIDIRERLAALEARRPA